MTRWFKGAVAIKRWLGSLAGLPGGAVPTAGETTRGSPAQSAAFTMALVALAAKMAKADGIAVPAEAAAFERLFTVAPEERAAVRRLYAQAAQDMAGYDIYAQRIARLVGGDKTELGGVLDCLLAIAAADGILHRDEDKFLRRVAEIFGFTPDELAARRRLFIADPNDPFTVLGLAPTASEAEVRARYLALVKEHHPDALAARGAPREMVEVATRKLAAINTAYEAIRARR
jgi:DnaJ like chaperone protein